MTDLAQLLARIERLDQENAVLRAENIWLKEKLVGGGQGERLAQAQLALELGELAKIAAPPVPPTAVSYPQLHEIPDVLARGPEPARMRPQAATHRPGFRAFSLFDIANNCPWLSAGENVTTFLTPSDPWYLSDSELRRRCHAQARIAEVNPVCDHLQHRR